MAKKMAAARKKAPAKKKARQRTLRIGMIGAGGRAMGIHYPSLRDLPNVVIAAVCDLDGDRAAAAAEQFDISGRYTGYQEMIEKEKLDAVYACMPPHHLHDVCANVIEMGCNLFIEKPPAVTTEQVRQLALLAHRHQVITGVTFPRRYSPLIRQGVALVEERAPIHTCHAAFYKNWVGARPYYKGAIDMLTCDGIHAVDTLRYMCGGHVVDVAADNRRLDAGHWNIHLALVKFSSGVTGVLLVNFMTGGRSFTVEVHGAGVGYFADPEVGGKLYADNQAEPVTALDPFEVSGSTEGYRAFGGYDTNLHFMDCLRRGVSPETDFGDAIETMELVEAIYGAQMYGGGGHSHGDAGHEGCGHGGCGGDCGDGCDCDGSCGDDCTCHGHR